MPDKAVPQASKDTDKTKVAGKQKFAVEMPGTPGLKSNYRQTAREKEQS